MSSWGEDLKIYERSKRGKLILTPASPTKRFVRTQKKTREPIDVVLQQYRDDPTEKMCQIREKRQLIDAINKGKDKAIEREGIVDNINHRSTYLGGDQMVPPPYQRPHLRPFPNRRAGVNYCIIGNQNIGNDKQRNSEDRKNDVAFSMRTALEAREFDIISNNYFVDDAKKKRIDSEFCRREAMQKYWKSNVFDAVKCVFNHPEMEKKYIEQQEARKLSHCLQRMRVLPRSLRESEGQLFNIISMQPIHEDILEKVDAKNAARKSGRKVRYVYEEMNRMRIFDEQDKEENLALGRISHERYNQTISRGYSIVNNISFEGSEGVPVPLPKTRASDPLKHILRQQAASAGKHEEIRNNVITGEEACEDVNASPYDSLGTKTHLVSAAHREQRDPLAQSPCVTITQNSRTTSEDSSFCYNQLNIPDSRIMNTTSIASSRISHRANCECRDVAAERTCKTASQVGAGGSVRMASCEASVVPSTHVSVALPNAAVRSTSASVRSSSECSFGKVRTSGFSRES